MSSPKTPVPPVKELDLNVKELRSLCRQFHDQCHHCLALLDFSSGDEQIEKWRAGAQEIPPKVQFSALRCRHGHTTCVGCGRESKLSDQHLFTPLGVVNHCCDAGRLYAIWILLSRFDEAEIKLTSRKPTPVKKKPSKKSFGSIPSGVGYAGDHISPYHNQFDYIMDDDEYEMAQMVPGYYQMQTTQPMLNVKENEKSKDILMIETLKLVTKSLPAPECDAIHELNLLRLSILFEKIADLIRNDSIEDINRRRDMFLEMCNFLKAMAERPALRGLLIENIARKKSPGLRLLGLGLSEDEFSIINSTAPSLFELSKNSYRQARMYMKLVQKTEVTEDRQSSIKICESIIEIHEMMSKGFAERNSPIDANNVVDSASSLAWTQYAEENRVTFTDEALLAHRSAREFDMLVSSSVKDRLNTISKEVATMTTSLPTGIFLKVAESRMDVMKVLIVGSEGSPYAGGLYTFDLFLPGNYPLSPPKMYFVLDGNDNEHHSFNPNLHKGGSVCLSILNTWHGSASEMWQPNKSTILSVLISIQAMILGAPMPWLNEPGMEIQGETAVAIEHKYLIQMKSLKYAMIAWLDQGWKAGTKEHIWKDVVRTYWKHNSTQAFEYAKEWAIENPRLLNWNNDNPFTPRAKKAKSKGKGKGKALAAEDVYAEVEGENLIGRLATLLGIEYEAPVQAVKREDSTSSKRKKLDVDHPAAGSSSSSTSAHLPKKQKSAIPTTSNHGDDVYWIYIGGRSQKDVRAACKEFGISYASTIKDTITKLENHVNGKGKVNADLVAKYFFFDEPSPEEMFSPNGSDSVGPGVGMVAESWNTPGKPALW